MRPAIKDVLVGKTITGYAIDAERQSITFSILNGEPVRLIVDAD